ncbi:polysaccharide biosynthesis tyrosine autokinase [Miltoncostaea oceani]|jgi:polysaccharide biosynthesis transport protein|uniref:polysaccharide biosynthesis tyrosine autokinase n=1 Tax=Miltoncostaea oceani TaxID=2843216 RepID=UPI001C3E41CD|nr:polysaccharide biosynthesis tyrosine autokinase [Miltoncostaea oceani]
METGRESSLSEPLALKRILAILRRRWWIVALAAVIVPVVAVFISSRQDPVYQSSADVLINQQNLAAVLTGTTDFSISRDPARITETQARIARSPEVAKLTVETVGVPELGAGGLLGSSSVTPDSKSDLLTFSVSQGDADLAGRLATEYARQYIAYRLRLDTSAIAEARTELAGRIAEVRAEGGSDALLTELTGNLQTLQTLSSLQTSNAVMVREAGSGSQTSPNPRRNGLLGLGLGLILGVGLAFLRESLDNRVRSAEEISDRLGLTLLARLPEPPRRMRTTNRLVMMDDPGSVQAEAFRMLRTNLDFVNADRRARTIAVTSAVNDEGKSTSAANLAVVLALAGSRVILVDLDLRRPTVHRFFGLPDRPGVTDVAVEDLDLSEALVDVPLELDDRSSAVPRNGAPGHRPGLAVLPSGPIPRDAGELAASRALGSLLARLRDQCDVVIIDTPPLLRVGDTMALSVYVDALVIVARMNVVSRPMLAEVSRLLRRMRAVKLGVVVTGAQTGDAYGGAYYGYGQKEALAAPPRERSPR